MLASMESHWAYATSRCARLRHCSSAAGENPNGANRSGLERGEVEAHVLRIERDSVDNGAARTRARRKEKNVGGGTEKRMRARKKQDLSACA